MFSFKNRVLFFWFLFLFIASLSFGQQPDIKNISATDQNGLLTIMMCLINNNNLELANETFNGLTNKSGVAQTLLLSQISTGFQSLTVEALEILLKYGAVVDYSLDGEIMPIATFAAGTIKDAKVLNLLCKRSSNINIRFAGDTALLALAKRSENDLNSETMYRMINVLLEAGADPNMKDTSSKTAWDYVYQREDTHKIEAFKILKNRMSKNYINSQSENKSNFEAQAKENDYKTSSENQSPKIFTNAIPNSSDEKAALAVVVSFYSDFLLTEYGKQMFTAKWLLTEKRLTPNLRVALKRAIDFTDIDHCPIACGNGGTEDIWVFASVETSNDIATITLNKQFLNSTDWHKIFVNCIKRNSSWQISDIDFFVDYKPFLFFVNSEDGLILREKESVNSEKQSLMPFLTILDIFDDSGKTDTINGIKGQWLLVDKISNDTKCLSGYCFSHFLEKIDLSKPLRIGTNLAIAKAMLGKPLEESNDLLKYSENDFINLSDNKVVSWSGFDEFKDFFVQ